MAKPELLSHAKFGRLLRALGAPAYVGVGVLEMLWQHAYAVSDDVVETAADLAWAVGWSVEDADRLAAALVESGFLDPDPHGFRIHNLIRHAPQYAVRRFALQRRARAGTSSRTVPDQLQEEQARSAPPHPVEISDPVLPFDGDGDRSAPILSDAFHGEQSNPINPRALTRLAFAELVARAPFESEGDAADALKGAAARHGLPYDGAAITGALDRLVHAGAVLYVDPIREKRKRA